MTGKPFRFLLMMLGGWTGMRTVMLWPEARSMPDLVGKVLGVDARMREGPLPAAAARVAAWPARARYFAAIRVAAPAGGVPAPHDDARRVRLALLGFLSYGGVVSPDETGTASAAPAPGPLAQAMVADRSRWSGSGWLLARGRGALGSAPGGGQLGGGQAGLRLAYAIDPARRIALVGRLAAPTRGVGREASIGVEWQPGRLPVRLIAERRVGLDGIRGGFGAGVVGGLGPLPLPLDFRLEGYGQAGAIARAVTEPYADGALRIARPVAGVGPARLDLGIGAWGGAQRGAQRIDIGPSLRAALPGAGRTISLSLDWRQRIAGAARPGSGPALSLGTDF